jgi:hypothetical protein
VSDSSFALQVLVCGVLALWLWGSCAGVGSLVLPRRADALAADAPVGWRQPGIAACVGLAVLVALGGVASVLEVPWWLPVGLVLVVGSVAAGRELLERARGRRPPRAVVLVGLLAAVALAGVAFVEAIPGLRFPLRSACDDLRAYLPMAEKLLATNTVLESWSARRLTLLGGYSYLQALPVWVFGTKGIGVVEATLGATFAGGLFVAPGFRATWARVLSLALVVAVPFLWVPRGNSTGVLIAMPLLVAVLAAATEIRAALRAQHWRAAARWAIAGGVVTAALISIRTPLGVFAAVLLAAAALLLTGVGVASRLQNVGVAAAATIVAVLPWSIASWIAVNSPFYPVFKGDLVEDAYTVQRSADLVRDLSRLVRAMPLMWIVAAVLVVAVVGRKLLPDAFFVAVAAVGAVVLVVAIGLQEPLINNQAFVRYIAPMVEALAVYSLYEAIRGADARARADAAAPVRAIAAGLVVATFLIGWFAFSGLMVKEKHSFFPSGIRLLRQAAANDTGSAKEIIAQRQQRNAYRRALAAVPDIDRALLAVDRAFLVDYDRYPIRSMDIPGWVAPGGEFPFFEGPLPKVEKLRAAGVDTLVASDGAKDLCIGVTLFFNGIKRDAYTRFFWDWVSSIDQIRTEAPGAVREFGPLLVIDLPRAEQGLRASR